MSLLRNPESDESVPENGGSQRRFRRSFWKNLSLFIAVLGLGAGVVWGLSGMRQKRTEFVGQMDPTSGLRCRFMIAADWKHEDASSHNSWAHLSPNYLDVDTFSAPPPSPLHKWILKHLFPSSASQGILPAINLISLDTNTGPHSIQIQAGYPELASRTQNYLLYTHRHLQIDGCPATMITASDKQFSGAALLVYVPSQSIAYIVSGYAAPRDVAQINHEMEEVVSSFHVEKGAVPMRGKGGGK